MINIRLFLLFKACALVKSRIKLKAFSENKKTRIQMKAKNSLQPFIFVKQLFRDLGDL